MENVLMIGDAVNIIRFTNIDFGNVRIVMESDKVPMFCLSDICKVLELRVDKVMERLDETTLQGLSPPRMKIVIILKESLFL